MDGSGITISLSKDRFGKDDRAIKMTEENKVIEWNRFTVQDLESFTFSYWFKHTGSNNHNEVVFISIAHNYDDNHFLVQGHKVIFAGVEMPFTNIIEQDKWVHFAIRRHKTEDYMEAFKNGVSIKK